MQVNFIAMGQADEYIQLAEGFRVIVARAGFEPGPEQVETHGVETQVGHLGKIRLQVGFVPFDRPTQAGLGRDPVGPDGQKVAAGPG